MAPQAGVNGVLPVTVLQKNAPASAPRGPKAPSPRLKLVCRRLPPGLTKAEFEAIIGDEWKLGAGKVDYFKYRMGKVSKDPAKPSKPSRAYVHVTQQAFITALDDRVRQVTFHDAAKSFQDSALVGPPVLEFAPYTKLPANRKRNDARQGTIDQDPEFKEFLESLTAPITKPAAPEGETQKGEKVKTTPLIEALRERKANKEKPQKKGRGEHKDDAAEKKILAKPGKEVAAGEKSRRATKAEASKEKAQKKAVEALNKEANALKENSSSEKAAAGPSSAAPERKRGNVNIAKSMLQRDLGLVPAPNRRRGTKREVAPAAQECTPKQDESVNSKQKGKEPVATPAAAVTPAAEKATPASPKKSTRAERRAFKASMADKTNKPAGEESKTSAKQGTTPAPTILKKPQAVQTQPPAPPKGPAARVPPTGPAAARTANATAQVTPAKTDASHVPRQANPTPLHATASSAPAPMGKQAFLKHANASQGITELLIEEALKQFGSIEKVEIDKRKGFAYVDFADPEGLRKAVAAGTVKVAQGAVQILERKDKHQVPRGFPAPRPQPPRPAQGRGGFGSRGRGRGGRGAHGGPGPASAPVASAPAADVAT